MANYVNFSHATDNRLSGKTVSESNADIKRLANRIANAAQNKVVVTGIEDEVDIKTFTMSNSERYIPGLSICEQGSSTSVLGSGVDGRRMQSYVGSTKAHQDISRDRIEVYRQVYRKRHERGDNPRLVAIGYIPEDWVRYSNRIEMSNGDRIKLYSLITEKYGSGGR